MSSLDIEFGSGGSQTVVLTFDEKVKTGDFFVLHVVYDDGRRETYFIDPVTR
ncbi:MAG: hypothetical protein SXQ77_02520 [Halobacteria archaeon]|nr:hypothetical protein [Halobacteria archaeon]